MDKTFKLTIKKEAQSIVDAIRFFELEFGETYLEYNDIFPDSKALMDFAISKGYISKNDYNLWKIAYDNSDYEAEENFKLIFGEDREYEPYCITYEESESELSWDEQYEKALIVYGELVCSNDEYFEKFIEEFSSGEGNLTYVEVITE